MNKINKTSNLLEQDLVPILQIGNKKTITVKDLINQIVEKLDKGEAYCLAVYARNLAEQNKETAELALEKALEALALAKKAYDLAIQCGGGGSIDDDLYQQLLTLIHNLENKVNNNSTLIQNILNSSIKASVASKTNEIIYKLYKGNTEFLSITVPQYKAGNNIDITNNVISVTNLPEYTGSEHIDITNNVISIKGLADVAISGNYSNLSNTPKQVSLFNNDAGYITEVDLESINDRLETLETCCEEFKKKEDYNVINHIPDSLLQNSSIDTDIQQCVAEIVSEKVISITDVVMNNQSIKDNCDITQVTPFHIILNYPKTRYSGIQEFITGDIYIEGTSSVLDVDYSVSIDAYVGNPRKLMATITRCFSEGTAVLELDSPPEYRINPSAHWNGVASPNKAVAFSDYKIRTITQFTQGTLEPDVRYEIEDAFIPEEIYFEMAVHDDTSDIDYPTVAHLIKDQSTTYTIRLEENQVIDTMKVKMGDEYITDQVYTYGSNVINIPSVQSDIQANFTTKTIQEEEEELSRYEVSINVTKPNGCSYNYSDNANVIQGVKTVTQGDTYTAQFSMSDSHYVMKSIKVKHNGIDVTSTSWNSASGVITIQDVQGNIEITIVLDTTYYKVFKSYNSQHCTYTDSVPSTGIPYGGTYTATISAKYGYKIDSVTATINGSPVGTYQDNTLTVSDIDGDIQVNVVSSLDESIPRTVNVLLDNNLNSVATITPTTMTIGSNFTTVKVTLANLYQNLSITKVSHGSTNITNKLNISISGNVATITPKSDIVIAQDIVVYGTYEAVKYSVKLDGDIKINGSIQPISGAFIQGGVCYVNKGDSCDLRIIHPYGVVITDVTNGVNYSVDSVYGKTTEVIFHIQNMSKNVVITGSNTVSIKDTTSRFYKWYQYNDRRVCTNQVVIQDSGPITSYYIGVIEDPKSTQTNSWVSDNYYLDEWLIATSGTGNSLDPYSGLYFLSLSVDPKFQNLDYKTHIPAIYFQYKDIKIYFAEEEDSVRYADYGVYGGKIYQDHYQNTAYVACPTPGSVTAGETYDISKLQGKSFTNDLSRGSYSEFSYEIYESDPSKGSNSRKLKLVVTDNVTGADSGQKLIENTTGSESTAVTIGGTNTDWYTLKCWCKTSLENVYCDKPGVKYSNEEAEEVIYKGNNPGRFAEYIFRIYIKDTAPNNASLTFKIGPEGATEGTKSYSNKAFKTFTIYK